MAKNLEIKNEWKAERGEGEREEKERMNEREYYLDI